MAATTTIPIVFGIGEDPVKEGLVTSLSRPSGNVTGYTNFGNQLVAKRLDLLRELVPSATTFGFLANQTNPNIDPDTTEVKAAADARGLRLRLLTASTDRELEMAFDTMAQQYPLARGSPKTGLPWRAAGRRRSLVSQPPRSSCGTLRRARKL